MTIQLSDVIKRVRIELGDQGVPFSDSFTGTGTLADYDLSEVNVWNLDVTWVKDTENVHLAEGTDYLVNASEGRIFLKGSSTPLPQGDTLIVTGFAGGLFSDDELEIFINDALLQHTHNESDSDRYRDSSGFIKYSKAPVTLANLPDVEGVLIALRATIEALWALATDASTDIDIQTADGTSVPRTQRYRQLRQQIDGLTERYNQLSSMLNVGLNRIEVGRLRRVPRRTERLVPEFESREYDDYTYPQRMLPPIDVANEDESGVPSPQYGGTGWW